MKKRFLNLTVLLPMLFLFGCASTTTQVSHYEDSEKYVSQQRYGDAIKIIEDAKTKTYKEKDRVLFWLDVGMLYHYNGEYEKSNEVLTSAEYAIEELFTKSVSKAIGSGVLNDNALDYFGEDYEDIYLNIFKCINYLQLGDFDDAFVEIKRIDVKLNMLEDKYKELVDEYNDNNKDGMQMQVGEMNFHNDALARYMSFLLYRADRDYDNARIDLLKIEEAFRDQSHMYNFPMPDLPEVQIPSGMAAVNVLSFAGKSPTKYANAMTIDSGGGGMRVVYEEPVPGYYEDSDSQSMSYVGGGDFHMRMEFPQMQLRGSVVERIEVSVAGGPSLELQMIENMEQVATEVFLVKQPMIITKTIIRATIKNITKEVGSEVAGDAAEEAVGGIGGALLGLLIDVAADVAVDASERADLRISHFFPAYAYAGELIIEPGTYDFTVTYYGGKSVIYQETFSDVVVESGGINLLNSYFIQ